MNYSEEQEFQEFQDFTRKWALKKMRKLEKKLRKYAKIYFGEPIAIIYARNGVKVVHKDGTEGTVKALDEWE